MILYEVTKQDSLQVTLIEFSSLLQLSQRVW